MTTEWLLSFLLFLFWGLQHWLPWLRTPKQQEQSEKPKYIFDKSTTNLGKANITTCSLKIVHQ
jgi:hypothetical protein